MTDKRFKGQVTILMGILGVVVDIQNYRLRGHVKQSDVYYFTDPQFPNMPTEVAILHFPSSLEILIFLDWGTGQEDQIKFEPNSGSDDGINAAEQYGEKVLLATFKKLGAEFEEFKDHDDWDNFVKGQGE